MNKRGNEKEKSEDEDNIECAICRNKHPFDIPNPIIEAIEREKLVIFAGAGISTEGKNVMPHTLYDDIRGELNISDIDKTSFSKLAEKYCELPNGRRKLLQIIKDRFNYIDSFPQLRNQATLFHNEIATIPQIKEIITTNWDDYFEQYCGATPIVTPEDFVFWDMPGRKVLKLHGSITSYGSLVITQDDYKECYRKLNTGILGSYLKQLLATKVVVFVGYSFGDEDFNKIFTILTKEMKELTPHAYIVTLDEKSHAKLLSSNITKIYTDGTFFIEKIKEHLVNKGLMLNDNRFEGIYRELFEITKEYKKLCENLSFAKNPETLFASSYQDGIIDAFERMITRYKTGEYSGIMQIDRLLFAYEEKKRKAEKQGYFMMLHTLVDT